MEREDSQSEKSASQPRREPEPVKNLDTKAPEPATSETALDRKTTQSQGIKSNQNLAPDPTPTSSEKPDPSKQPPRGTFQTDISLFYTGLFSLRTLKLYRCSMLAITLIGVIVSLAVAVNRLGLKVVTHGFIFLTTWSAIIFVIDITLSAIVILRPAPEAKNGLPLLIRIHWVVYVIAANASIVVAIGFWALVYNWLPPEIKGKSIFTLHIHGLNMLYHLINAIIVDTPVYARHIWIPMLYCCAYALFSTSYYLAGGRGMHGRAIYELMDFAKHPAIASVLAVFLAVGAPIVSHLSLCGLKWLRSVLRARLGKRQKEGTVS